MSCELPSGPVNILKYTKNNTPQNYFQKKVKASTDALSAISEAF